MRKADDDMSGPKFCSMSDSLAQAVSGVKGRRPRARKARQGQARRQKGNEKKRKKQRRKHDARTRAAGVPGERRRKLTLFPNMNPLLAHMIRGAFLPRALHAVHSREVGQARRDSKKGAAKKAGEPLERSESKGQKRDSRRRQNENEAQLGLG